MYHLRDEHKILVNASCILKARIIKKGLCQNLGTSCVTYVIIHNLGKNLSEDLGEDLGEVLIKFSPRSSLDLTTVTSNDHA